MNKRSIEKPEPFKIEKNIPIPETRIDRTEKMRRTLQLMEIGDSLYLDVMETQCCYELTKLIGWTIRRQKDLGTVFSRVWLVSKGKQ
jgi:hypothetical protein